MQIQILIPKLYKKNLSHQLLIMKKLKIFAEKMLKNYQIYFIYKK